MCPCAGGGQLREQGGEDGWGGLGGGGGGWGGCSYYNLMEINLKIKIDKHSKTRTWDRPEPPFFFDHPATKRTRVSPKSQREEFQQPPTDVVSTLNSSRKPATARKGSASKAKIDKLDKKCSTVQKNNSELRTKGKRKLGADESIRPQEEGLRGSLPGLSGKKVLQKFAPMLSEHQKIELINEKTVYYLGVGSGAGEDDLEGRYIWRKHEQLGWRYELLEGLGRGAFGEVVRAVDHKSHEMVAVKIVRAGREHMQLALNEINILMKVKEQDIENKKNLLRIRDFIVFRRHICIITELLATSLYQLLQSNQFGPLDAHNIRAFAIQLLASLAFLRQLGVIHSDIKPENVLMKHRSKVGIKLVDFGTSMFAHEATFTYIQSRFYRAPEVILGGTYSYPIDMWSFGCLIAELQLGYPLFAGDNEQEQLSLVLRAVGAPAKEYLINCKHAQKYFGKDYSPKIIKGKDGKAILPSSRPLASLITDAPLAAFLEKILRFDPAQRLTPLQALIDPWVLAYFPEDIKKEHMNEILLKIKKEEGDTGRPGTCKPSSAQKGHKKRNSELHGGSGTGHRRRGSEGLF